MRNSKSLIGLLLLALFLFSAMGSSSSPSIEAKVYPDAALKLLKQGNARFVSGKSLHRNQTRVRRHETAVKGQKPFAAILSCSDSRVPPEILFDQGIGDLFVIRVAGNVADTNEIGTLEYGVEHLGSTLVVVMGHTRCGAVTAVATGAEARDNVLKLVEHIVPAVKKARELNPTLQGESLVPEATKANIFQSMEDIFRKSHLLREKVSCGGTALVGALYDIDSGKVVWLGAHPEEKKLIEEIRKAAPAPEKPPAEK